jgi:hypothetical protein
MHLGVPDQRERAIHRCDYRLCEYYAGADTRALELNTSHTVEFMTAFGKYIAGV